MPQFVIVTVNDYHRSEPVEWGDGSRHVFYHGGEFSSSLNAAHEILQQLRSVGKTTVKLTSDSIQVTGFNFRCALTDSKYGLALYGLLNLPLDTSNPSCLINHALGAEFHDGNSFTIGELILAEVMRDCLLIERGRALLRSPQGEDIHAVDAILQTSTTHHARISE